MITIYEYPLQMIVPEERHQNGYDNLGQDKHIVYIMSQQSVHPVHTGTGEILAYLYRSSGGCSCRAGIVPFRYADIKKQA